MEWETKYKCRSCGWAGKKSELDCDGGHCPECGDVVRSETMPCIPDKEKVVLAARAECMNHVHRFINDVVPALHLALEGGFKQKTDGELYERDASHLRMVLASTRGLSGRASSAYIKADSHGVWLEVKDSYPVKPIIGGGYTCDYYGRTVYLWSNTQGKAIGFAPYAMHTQEQMIAASQRLSIINEEISNLQSEASGLRRVIGK